MAGDEGKKTAAAVPGREEFVRGIRGNCLAMDCAYRGYKLRMLEDNPIPGLLPLQTLEEDGSLRLLYRTGSLFPFRERLAGSDLTAADVRGLVSQLGSLMETLRYYMLDPEDLVLDADHIYTDGKRLRFCCVPGAREDVPARLSVLLRDVLGAVDHTDADAVILAYSLYQETLKERYVMQDLERIVYDGKEAETVTEAVTEAQVSAGPFGAGSGPETPGSLPEERLLSFEYAGAEEGGEDEIRKLFGELKDGRLPAGTGRSRRKTARKFALFH